MPGRDVPDFMCQYGGQFIFVAGDLNQAAVDVNRPARKTQRVDFFRVDDSEFVLDTGYLRILHDTLADDLNIPVEIGFPDNLEASLGLS